MGQKLKVPSRSSALRKKRKGTSRKIASTDFHTVRSGDNLTSISKKYNVSVANLKNANNLKGNTIHPGQKIQLQKKSSPVQSAAVSKHHVVKKGETLIGIAKQYQVSLMKLLDINSLNLNSVILTGTRLVIPK